MTTLNNAKKMALDYVNKDFDLSEFDDRIEIFDEKTLELPQGWVFYYNSVKFKETNDFQFMLLGNSPVFVSQETGIPSYIRGDLEAHEAVEKLIATKL
ncbi:YrhB domain-containing protein [Undibacterium sp. TC9W]|uniref:YrhB domain-containing protein n=1 Tax=Undibacterium sp. TC9W TaxID=3413053 RepID=UPI003BF31040